VWLVLEVSLSRGQYEWVVPDSITNSGFEFDNKKWIKLLLESSDNKSNIWVRLDQ